jgi:archaeosine-15-forming tRNA-guanine transglycosylase
MRMGEFKSLKVIVNDDFSNLKAGGKFLYGENVIKQKNNKKVGENVTFYVVDEIKSGGNVMYSPQIEKLEA